MAYVYPHPIKSVNEKIRILLDLLAKQANYVRQGDMKRAMEVNTEMRDVAHLPIEPSTQGKGGVYAP